MGVKKLYNEFFCQLFCSQTCLITKLTKIEQNREKLLTLSLQSSTKNYCALYENNFALKHPLAN